MSLKVWLPLNNDYRYVYDGIKNDLAITGHQMKSFLSPVGTNATYNVLTTGNITIPNAQNVIKGKHNASACIWAYNFKTSNQCLFNIWKGGSYFAFGIWNNGYYLRTAKTGDSNSTTYGPQRFIELGTPQANTWVHYAITFDNGVAKGYVNGNFVGSGLTFQGDSLLSNSDRCLIGGYSASYPFSGYVCDFRIYDNTLSDEDVKRIYQQKMFELVPYSGAEDVLFDRSGLMNMLLVNQNAVFQNNALYFNGTNAMLRPKNGNVGFTMDDGTLSVWFSISTAPTGYQMLYIDSVSKFAIGFLNSGGFIVTCNNSAMPTFSASHVKYDGSINSIIVSYNTSKTPQFCLINGIQEANVATNNWTETSGLTIGSRMYNTANSNFKGKIFKVGVYNRQFTQDEAVELYNSERRMFLPDDYIQLEYIQSDGAQFIDTEIKPCMNKIRCICDMSPLNNADTPFFGSRGTYYMFYLVSGNYFWPTSKCETIQGTLAIGEKYHLDWNKGTLIVTGPNGVYQKGVRSNNTQDTYNMYIFNFNPKDSSRTCVAKLYNFKIYFDDLLVRCFIPAKRKSDNVIGLYDTVSRRFFTNSGTGSFTGA